MVNMVTPRQEIPLTETWIRSNWNYFDTNQPITSSSVFGRNGDGVANNFGLTTQNHIDLRTFASTEPWTGNSTYSFGSVASLNHWYALTCTVPTGVTTVQTATSTMPPLDLTQEGTSANLVLALPNFPLSSIDLTNSWLDLSSDGFVTTICSLQWSASTLAVTSGNTTLGWLYSALQNVDLTAITDIRIRITPLSACTVYATALRMIGSQWVYTNVDFDSINGQLHQTIPLNGATTATTPGPNGILPPFWRSALTPGVDDPMPINSELQFVFNTGSQTANNTFTLYMRENGLSYVTQLNLNGQTQASLTGQPQPVLSTTNYGVRTMADMDRLTMDQLNTRSMADIERTVGPGFDHWISFSITWGTVGSIITINNSTGGPGYQYPVSTLANNTTYMAICNLTNASARMQIYNVDQTTHAIGTLVFDTTIIPDDFTFPREAGRIGFQASLGDGDAYIGPIRPRSLMFAEYRSKPLLSQTPVRGAQLYVNNSPDTELFTTWEPLADSFGNVPTINTDQQKYISTDAHKASTSVLVSTVSNSSPAQGIISNWLTPINDSVSGITNFAQLHIAFNIWVPSIANTINGLPLVTAAFVSARGNVIPITLPPLLSNQWNAISIMQPITSDALTPYPGSGLYQFALYYNGTQGATWWVDGASIHEHSIGWWGRSVGSDPWHSNYAPWTYFHDEINQHNSGILFTTVGSELQVRGQAFRQGAVVLSPPTVIPRYAELGNFVWPENVQNYAPPTAASTYTRNGRTFTFDGRSSSGPQPIYNYHWSFGDGTYSAGPIVTHTYPSWVPVNTMYIMTLTVIDSAGLTASNTTQVIM